MKGEKAMKDYKCPHCGKFGLHPYDKKGLSPINENMEKIDHYWCLFCNYKFMLIQQRKEKKQ
jgi:hypothetical protein